MAKIIMGIQLEQRKETARSVQELLTEFGCSIKTRIGLHEASEDRCSSKGIIVLEFIDSAEKDALELEEKLLEMKDVIVKKMEF